MPPEQFNIIQDAVGFRAAFNVEAEQALLGALLVTNAGIDKVSGFLRPGHFSEEVHGRIYEACLDYWAKGKSFNPIKLKPYFEEDPALEDVGGIKYLVRLAGSAPSVFNPEDYAEAVVEAHKRRTILGVCQGLTARVGNPDIKDPIDDLLDLAEQELFNARSDAIDFRGWVAAGDRVFITVEDIAKAAKDQGMRGVSTGLKRLDLKLGGLQGGKFYVVAGRPGMGKSIIGNHLARHAAKAPDPAEKVRGVGVGIVSLEMDRDECLQRLISDETNRQGEGVHYYDMQTGKISDDEEKKRRGK